MARPKSIPWKKRMEIFLDYRLRKSRVYPTAKRHDVARSTVSAIVKEFQEMGFSTRPRAKLLVETLRELQEHHLRSVVCVLHGGGSTLEVVADVGLLDVSPALNEERGLEAKEKDPLHISEDLAWHLRGTNAERLIEDARSAARDYHKWDYEAWRDLRAKVEKLCDPPVQGEETDDNGESYILPELVSRLRNAFFNPAFRQQLPTEECLLWRTDPDDSTFLRLNDQRVAVGSETDHKRIKSGIERFRKEDFRALQLRFLELERLRHDLGLLQGMLTTTLQEVSEEDVRRGICPECPYPEMNAALDLAPEAIISTDQPQTTAPERS